MIITRLNVSDRKSGYLEYAAELFGLDVDGSRTRKSERATGVHRESLTIMNESNPSSGENVGGSNAAPAAPEVAVEDDDGDGDPDAEPERRSRHRSRNTLPFTAEHFDRLPDSAQIDIASLKAITGKSRATLYRWIEKGILPKPRKLGLTHNFWNAGDIRRALQG